MGYAKRGRMCRFAAPGRQWCSLIILGLLVSVLILATACTRLPVISPVAAQQTAAATARCKAPFVTAPWQFVHAISAEMPGRRLNQLVGVSVIDPGPRTIDAVLMTIEGLVVFAARWDGEVSVSRALPPFHQERLAEGLMADIRLLFFVPDGLLIGFGRTDGGLMTCRYAENDGTTVDVMVDAGRGWEICRYDPHGRRTRTAKVRNLPGVPTDTVPAARKMELTAHGRNGYHLTLNPISAEPVDSQGITRTERVQPTGE